MSSTGCRCGSGERICLISATPDGPWGPYIEVGPVFVHADDCGGPVDDGVYPPEWRARGQVLRAYGPDGRIVGGEVVEAGTGQEDAVERLLRDSAVGFVQTRNIVFGCYMATIVRVGADMLRRSS